MTTILAATAAPAPEGSAAAGFVVLAFIAFSIVVYFLPIFVAGLRGKSEGQLGIFLITVFGGWTGVLWLVCLIWAFTGRTKADVLSEETKHKQLLAALATKSALIIAGALLLFSAATSKADVTVKVPADKMRSMLIVALTHDGYSLQHENKRSLSFVSYFDDKAKFVMCITYTIVAIDEQTTYVQTFAQILRPGGRPVAQKTTESAANFAQNYYVRAAEALANAEPPPPPTMLMANP
jgi:hypothetical protein